jgi:hypothetical protein
MLADYPNPNGWKIIPADVFASDVLDKQLETSQIVLCNPPFEDFTPQERKHYRDKIQSVHKPREILNTVLKNPPAMFGFVLPKSAVMGERYVDIQDRIARTYEQIETIALPDRIFAFSDQETILVLASKRNKSAKANIFTRTFWVRENDRQSFLQVGRLPIGIDKSINRSTHTTPVSLWNVPLSDIWDYLKSNPNLQEIADVHRGIEWNISLNTNRDILISSDSMPGFKKGLDKISGKIEPYGVQGIVYLNMDERYRRTNAHSLPWDRPKVIVNRAIISRGPWRIVGVPDKTGLVCRENFIAIWPKTNITVEVISALINSPLVNAALYVRGGKRLNQIYTLEQIPIPFPEAIDTEKITHLVINYANLRSRIKDSDNQQIIRECILTLMEIDSLILKAYDLPPRLERQLLECFRGYPRPLPFDFPEYYPEDFGPCISLYKYLKMDLKQASAGELLKKIKPFNSEDMHEFFMDIEAGQS